jgi:altronate dehydratase large subunit
MWKARGAAVIWRRHVTMPSFDQLSEPTAGRLPEAPLAFRGYRRADGRVGVRNHVVVLSTVVCANAVVERIVQQTPGAAPITHPHGCGHLGADFELAVDTLTRTGSHPNVAAVLVVGLGCEQIEAAILRDRIQRTGRPVQSIIIQDAGGELKAIAQGTAVARQMVADAALLTRESAPLTELVVAMECGSSDATSGIAANPIAGLLSDRIVAAGGTVLLAEAAELLGAEHILARRGVTLQVGKEIVRMVERVERLASVMGVDMRGSQPTPGNMAGGISTIEEKSLGCIHKAGSAPIQGVLGFGQPPAGKGLYVMDTPGQDAECTTGMVAGGAQIVVFTTGRGTPLGNPVAPVIKVTGNARTAERMADHIDFRVDSLMAGSGNPQDLADGLWNLLLEVANGRLVAAEALGHREFALHRLGRTI